MNYIKIDTCNMNNGDGLRCVVWLTGCDHHCQGCFNPETWDYEFGEAFGQEQQDIIFRTLEQDWCSGITFTGGDPFFHKNIQEVMVFCKKIKNKFPSKTIWIYTGGDFEKYKDFQEMKYVDVIVDGCFLENLKSPMEKWVGSYNQRVIDVKKSLKTGKITLF